MVQINGQPVSTLNFSAKSAPDEKKVSENMMEQFKDRFEKEVPEYGSFQTVKFDSLVDDIKIELLVNPHLSSKNADPKKRFLTLNVFSEDGLSNRSTVLISGTKSELLEFLNLSGESLVREKTEKLYNNL